MSFEVSVVYDAQRVIRLKLSNQIKDLRRVFIVLKSINGEKGQDKAIKKGLLRVDVKADLER